MRTFHKRVEPRVVPGRAYNPFFNSFGIRSDQSRRHPREGVMRTAAAASTPSGGFFMCPRCGAATRKLFRSWRFRIPARSTALGDNSRTWTNDEIAKLKRMAGRIPRDQIAAKLGRSPSATAMEASKLGISLSLQPDIRRALRSRGTKKRRGE